MFHSFELTKSVKRVRKIIYDNDSFFVCWNEPDDDENETLDFYSKPVHANMRASFSINIESNLLVQNVNLLENHCIVEFVDMQNKYFEVYTLDQGAHSIAKFLINAKRHSIFQVDTTSLVYVDRHFYFQEMKADSSIDSFNYNNMIPVKHFSDDPFLKKVSFDTLPEYFKSHSWYASNFMFENHVYVDDYEITIYKHLLFVQQRFRNNNTLTFTRIYTVNFSEPIIKQVISHKGKVFYSQDKIIFWSGSIINIKDIHTFDYLYQADIEYMFDNYNVFLPKSDLLNDEEIEMLLVSETSKVSYYRNLIRKNPENVIKIYVSSSFDICVFFKEETTFGTSYTTFNFGNKSILSVIIKGISIGSEVQQIGNQNLIISDKKISVLMNENIHAIVQRRARCGMFRAEHSL